MFAARGVRGRFIHWDWQQKKYVWVSTEDLRDKAFNKDQVLKPSPYLQNAGSRKKSNPLAKRVFRRPLQVYNRQAKPSSPAKQTRVLKLESAAKPSLQYPTRKSSQRRHPVPASTNMAAKELENKKSHDETDGSNLPPPELLQGHDTFMSVMTNRLIHQGAALTFWKQSPDALISYLIRTNDDAVTVDVLPMLTESFSGLQMASSDNQISMGSCLDLIPVLRRLLDRKFEDYVKASLDFLRTMLRYYRKDLLAMKATQKLTNLQRSQSLYGIYTAIVSMTDKVNKLARRKDSVGQKATIVADLIEEL